MEHSTAQRRLVRSPSELWAEGSSEEAPARRPAQFGEIRTTRVEPETTVAWEGDRASGTVELEPAGWGTRVTLTAVHEPPPAPNGFLARLFRRRPARATATPDPSPPALGPEPPPPDPDPAPTPAERAPATHPGDVGFPDARTTWILGEMLDDLGAGHHRQFSRD